MTASPASLVALYLAFNVLRVRLRVSCSIELELSSSRVVYVNHLVLLRFTFACVFLRCLRPFLRPGGGRSLEVLRGYSYSTSSGS